MATSGISFFQQSILQSERLLRGRADLYDLQRQLTTQKRYDNLQGFGAFGHKILRLHADTSRVETYVENIKNTKVQIQISNGLMDQARKVGTDLIRNIKAQGSLGPFDMETIAAQAQEALRLMTDIANHNLDGRYTFAGTDTSNAPVADKTAANAFFQNEVSLWLDGTNDTDTFLANINAATDSDIGFSNTIASAENIEVRIDDDVEIAYSAVATDIGFNDMIRILAVTANMVAPDPATDIPTNTDMNTVIYGIIDQVQLAVDSIVARQKQIAGSNALMEGIKESHEIDLNVFQAQIEDKENVDPTEAIAKIQTLQTQLQASYEVTNITSRLSLINFLDF